MDLLKRAFHDISLGYTRGIIQNRVVYIRHLSYGDQTEFDRINDSYFKEAKDQGILTNDEMLKSIIDQGIWSQKKEKEINDSKLFIESMISGKKKHTKMPSMVLKINEQIKEEEAKYYNLVNEKFTLLGLTCEAYAQKQTNDHYIFNNLFLDEILKIPFFSSIQFDYLDDFEINLIVADYNKILEGCSEQNIKRLAMQDFFQNYFCLTGENLSQFFGKPICALTFFQVKLLSYGGHFKSIYQNNDMSIIPQSVKNDPDLLTDHVNTVTKGKSEMEKQGAYDSDAIVVGMKKEDRTALGIADSKIDMNKEMAKNGGNLGLDWFIKRDR